MQESLSIDVTSMLDQMELGWLLFIPEWIGTDELNEVMGE